MLAIPFSGEGATKRGRRILFQSNPLGLSITRLAICAALGLLILILHWAYHDPIIRVRLYDGHSPLVLPDYYRNKPSACSALWDGEFQRLQKSNRMLVQTYADGKPVQDSDKLDTSAKVCVVVAVPQSMPSDRKLRYAPVQNYGPDDMRLLINSSTIQHTFTPLKPIGGQDSLKKLLANDAILYYAEPSITDKGNYDIHVWREWSNWAWSKQFSRHFELNTTIYSGGYSEAIESSPLKDPAHLLEKDIERLGRHPDPEPILPTYKFPQSLHFEGRPRNYSALPPCGPTISAAKGKWYKASEYHIDERFADEWGFAWVPDECRFDYFSEKDAVDCLANKVIHVNGDSNSRRLARMIMSVGRWCHGGPNQRCQIEDIKLPIDKVNFNQTTGSLIPSDEPVANFTNGLPFTFGRNSTIYFNFLESLSFQQLSWVSLYYDLPPSARYRPDFFKPSQNETLLEWQRAVDRTFVSNPLIPEGATPRAPPELPKADVVLFGPGAWDQSFDSTFEEYEFVLPVFRDSILSAYNDSVKVVRLSQGYCCRRNFTDYPWRRYTGARIDVMTQILRKVFRVKRAKGMNGALHILDPSGFAGRPEVVTDYVQDTSNHHRAAHVRLEYQMFLNTVCLRNPVSKKVTFRENLKLAGHSNDRGAKRPGNTTYGIVNTTHGNTS